MKKILFVSLILVLASSAIAQEKGYIGVEFGTAIPRSDFAATDTSNNRAGYAKPGYFLGISGTYQFSNTLGLAYSIRRQRNGVDNESIASQKSAEYSNSPTNVQSDAYFLNGFKLGGYFTVAITDIFHWDTKLMAGIMMMRNPGLNISIEEGTNQIEIIEQEANSNSFSLSISSGFRLDIASKLGLTLKVESVYANPTYTDIETETKLNGSSIGITKKTYSQRVNNLNVGLGLVYRFN